MGDVYECVYFILAFWLEKFYNKEEHMFGLKLLFYEMGWITCRFYTKFF